MQFAALTERMFTAHGMFRATASRLIKYRSCKLRHPDAGEWRAANFDLANPDREVAGLLLPPGTLERMLRINGEFALGIGSAIRTAIAAGV